VFKRTYGVKSVEKEFKECYRVERVEKDLNGLIELKE
jgi:hypothetical protein